MALNTRVEPTKEARAPQGDEINLARTHLGRRDRKTKVRMVNVYRLFVMVACAALAASPLLGVAVGQEPTASTALAAEESEEPTPTEASATEAPSGRPTNASGTPKSSDIVMPPECRDHTKELGVLLEDLKTRFAAKAGALRAEAEKAKAEFLATKPADGDLRAFEATWKARIDELHDEAMEVARQAFQDAGLAACFDAVIALKGQAIVGHPATPKPVRPDMDAEARAIMDRCEARIRAYLSEHAAKLPTPRAGVGARLPGNLPGGVSSSVDIEASAGVPDEKTTVMPNDVSEEHAALQAKVEQLRRACAEELRDYFQEHKAERGDRLRGSDAYPNALAHGKVGAEVSMKKGKAETSLLRDGFEVRDVKMERARFSARIDSTDATCKTVVFEVEPGELADAAARLDVRVTDVATSGEERPMDVQMANGLEDVLDGCDDGPETVEYWAVTDANGLQLLVSFPHFSEKKVEVASAATAGASVPGFEATLMMATLAVALGLVGSRRRA